MKALSHTDFSTECLQEDSMHRSHRWAVRSLEEFKRIDSGAQTTEMSAIMNLIHCRVRSQ